MKRKQVEIANRLNDDREKEEDDKLIFLLSSTFASNISLSISFFLSMPIILFYVCDVLLGPPKVGGVLFLFLSSCFDFEFFFYVTLLLVA